MVYWLFTPRTQSSRRRPDQLLLGKPYGRIKAVETTYVERGFNAAGLDLHFEGSLPLPPVAPDLPGVGDPIIPQLPKIALGAGGLLLVSGLSMMMIRGRLPARGTQ